MFFHFSQNNSGGVFDDKVGRYVIIEANSAEQANVIAKTKGIYFGGVSKGEDCPCCGDRWTEAYGDGDKQPSIYGRPVKLVEPSMFRDEVVIHYLDGHDERVKLKLRRRKKGQK